MSVHLILVTLRVLIFFFFFLRGVLRNMLVHSLGLKSYKQSLFLPPFGKFPYRCHFLWGPGEPQVNERVKACKVSWRHKELATSSYTFGVYKAHLLSDVLEIHTGVMIRFSSRSTKMISLKNMYLTFFFPCYWTSPCFFDLSKVVWDFG